MMVRKIGLWLLWIGFIVYGLFLSPPIAQDLARLGNVLSGNWTSINPLIIALFSLIGMWIMIYSCLIFADGRMQAIPAWPFVLASLGSGVLGLIPYLALRDDQPTFAGRKDGWLQFWDTRRTGVLISLSTLLFLGYGWLAGDWNSFIHDFLTSRFIHLMSLAFVLFGLLFPVLLGDDMARRGLFNTNLFWSVALVPLLGPLVYLCSRPPLRETTLPTPQSNPTLPTRIV